ncbi:MAG: YceI family protein [Candidatus Nomurabacteria bacterium GW2011_GWF2_35_66]|uniref:YceI family protein n=1 Tax=Candidatus Nomurabacteria bacterium GW2011_GWE1_35_16 TaxID=1618761 RepID=A0A0G0BAM3_9BACT|nr:MAG: YceI family protein [Candidatus Nomurabacteria bacterium GW2011_GWF1_34_20]KKP62980.1 MAG: YceI family protein [Candidatus Nomurabacteria bacterium GW2011_GWE2_34_25]KKP66384.1 MAG: YceI family protein [Candidatus Nomurabacteria bacterium GW2011_GWE1_35_16]KKP83176.1 MAG: YceI family protein [Candidatus Nomurabacteria bacterium GW2011_GWF2_35_66]HAE36523.1 hypothetical protein [Candidatus Nomurabacteria bacterium]
MNKWSIDTMHSIIGFKVKHLMISNIRGQFNKFDGSVEMEDSDFIKASIKFKAETNSISTNNTDRDGHLMSPDFFDVTKFPVISFVSKEITEKGDNNFVVTGDLEIHGVVKEVNLDVKLNGIGENMNHQSIMSFDALGTINRKDFGLNWSATLDKGEIVVSDNVDLDISVELVKSNS